MKDKMEVNKKLLELSVSFLGRELSRTEVRLLPYIDYCIKNGGFIDPQAINKEEINIFKAWEALGFLVFKRCTTKTDFPGTGLKFKLRYSVQVSREFYDFVNNILWLTRCNQN